MAADTNGLLDFVFIANAWGAGLDNPTSKHRIALELARRGHRVLWMEGAGMRAPRVGAAADRGRMWRKVRDGARPPRLVFGDRNGARPADGASGHGAVWVVSPLSLPLPKHNAARRLNGGIYLTTARFWAKRLGFAAPILVNYVPVLAEAMRGWSGATVYHCVDRWDAFDMYDSALMAEMDRRCCVYADLVIASSRELKERCERFSNNVRLVMHGVDHGHFANALAIRERGERPSDLPRGPIIGFFGLLSEWLDQELLVRLAEATPEAQIVLIGRPDVDVSRLGGHDNLVMPGPKPFADLPRYAAFFDVAIIPFVVNELTRAVNPIKLREMLAAGCPVVSTSMPEVERVAEGNRYVTVAKGERAFLEAVGNALAAPASLEERRSISESVRADAWAGKTQEILAAIAPCLSSRP